jgi:hypothetical protein
LAIEFYHLFEEILVELNKPSLFRGILIEEHRHLAEILNCLQNDVTFTNNINLLTVIEQNSFNCLIKTIENSI